MKYLIVGATGYIGSYLMDHLSERNGDVCGTTRNKHLASNNLIYSDLSNSDSIYFSDPFPGEINKLAILAASVSSINECYEKFEYAYKINVTNSIKMIDYLHTMGYRVLFFSTDNVFDGQKGCYSETEVPNPLNNYGKMKREVEEYILNRFSDDIVMRLTKVVGNAMNSKDIFNVWKRDAIEGLELKCIRNNYFTPLAISDVATSIRFIADNRENIQGLVHLGGPDKISRIDLCKSFLDYIKVKAVVKECSISEINIKDGWPLDTSFKTNIHIKESVLFHSVKSLYDLYLGEIS